MASKAVEAFVDAAAFSVVVFADGNVGLLKLFCRVTRALMAEQSRGVCAGTLELKDADAYSASNSLRIDSPSSAAWLSKHVLGGHKPV